MAACSGDVRVALAICRRAIELARLEGHREQEDENDENLNPFQRRLLSSPALKKHSKPTTPTTVVSKNEDETEPTCSMPTIRHISQAIREATASCSVYICSIIVLNSLRRVYSPLTPV